MNTNRYFFALASILLLGCQNADKSTSQVQKLKGQSNCLEVLPVSVRLDGGSSSIGSNIAYPEERPEQKVTLGSFEIEASEVTNKQFSTFVEETGYITDAEKPQPIGRADVFRQSLSGNTQPRQGQRRSTLGAMNVRRMEKKKQILGRALSPSKIPRLMGLSCAHP